MDVCSGVAVEKCVRLLPHNRPHLTLPTWTGIPCCKHGCFLDSEIKMREWEMRVLQVMMMMIWTTQSLCSRRSGEDDSLVDVGIAPNNLMVAPI
ncbi:hypothetical protein ACFX13_029449 [Malus domestica]